MLGQSPGDRDWEAETALLKQTVLLTQAQAVQTCRQVSRGGTNLQKEHTQTHCSILAWRTTHRGAWQVTVLGITVGHD